MQRFAEKLGGIFRSYLCGLPRLGVLGVSVLTAQGAMLLRTRLNGVGNNYEVVILGRDRTIYPLNLSWPRLLAAASSRVGADAGVDLKRDVTSTDLSALIPLISKRWDTMRVPGLA